MSDLVDQAENLDQPTLAAGQCEACFLAEAVVSVGLAVLCEECAVEHAWQRFLSALAMAPGQPRQHRRTWAEL